MKFSLLIASVFGLIGLSAAACKTGFWGEGCLNVCGHCHFAESDAVQTCNVTGDCPGGCYQGWTGAACNQAVCEQDCGPGKCVSPGICDLCGNINLIKPNCEDIRLRGLLGSLLAFVVVSVSITLCGLGSVWYKRRHEPKVSH